MTRPFFRQDTTKHKKRCDNRLKLISVEAYNKDVGLPELSGTRREAITTWSVSRIALIRISSRYPNFFCQFRDPCFTNIRYIGL